MPLIKVDIAKHVDRKLAAKPGKSSRTQNVNISMNVPTSTALTRQHVDQALGSMLDKLRKIGDGEDE